VTKTSISKDVVLLAAGFAASGVVHLVKPDVYKPLMPRSVPAHHEVIIGSGIAELALAAGLLHPRTRRLAGWGSVGLLLGVYPANLKMANDARKSNKSAFKLAAFGRLPLQLPMIRVALKAARNS
jgi:uncharacterized membrane protein